MEPNILKLTYNNNKTNKKRNIKKKSNKKKGVNNYKARNENKQPKQVSRSKNTHI